MSRVLVLDAAAVEGLCRRQVPTGIRAALEAASRLGRDVLVPSAVLAECYRDRRHAQALDSMPARRTAIRLRNGSATAPFQNASVGLERDAVSQDDLSDIW